MMFSGTSNPALAFLLVLLFSLSWSTSLAARTVVDARGLSITVPDKPLRVLALSELDLDAAIALKLVPIGATNGRGQDKIPHYLKQEAQAVSSVGPFAAPILDKVIALQPDLILAGGLPDPELLAQLQRIAPTVVSYRLGENWKVAFSRIATLLGRTPQAADFLKTYQQQLQRARARLTNTQHARVSVVRWNPQGPAYMLKDSFASQVLSDLQLQRPPAQLQAGMGHSQPLSLEALNRIDGDWLFIGTLTPQGQANDALKTVQTHPAFQQLNAVKKHHLVMVDGSLWTGLGGPLAALALVRDVSRAMESSR